MGEGTDTLVELVNSSASWSENAAVFSVFRNCCIQKYQEICNHKTPKD